MNYYTLKPKPRSGSNPTPQTQFRDCIQNIFTEGLIAFLSHTQPFSHSARRSTAFYPASFSRKAWILHWSGLGGGGGNRGDVDIKQCWNVQRLASTSMYAGFAECKAQLHLHMGPDSWILISNRAEGTTVPLLVYCPVGILACEELPLAFIIISGGNRPTSSNGTFIPRNAATV